MQCVDIIIQGNRRLEGKDGGSGIFIKDLGCDQRNRSAPFDTCVKFPFRKINIFSFPKTNCFLIQIPSQDVRNKRYSLE